MKYELTILPVLSSSTNTNVSGARSLCVEHIAILQNIADLLGKDIYKVVLRAQRCAIKSHPRDQGQSVEREEKDEARNTTKTNKDQQSIWANTNQDVHTQSDGTHPFNPFEQKKRSKYVTESNGNIWKARS